MDAAIDAVSVEPLIPNDTPFAFEKVTALRLFEVVPAETLTTALAVMVDAFNPNETLFEFENVTADRLLLVVPAETFTA
jgi:hypothetical protein